MTILSSNPVSRSRAKANFFPTIDSIFNEFINHAPVNKTVDAPKSTASKPATNITEKKDKYLVQLAIPGLTKDDVNINVEKELLRISGNKEISETNDKRVIKSEFSFHKFERNFKLPKTIDAAGIAAKVENGILTVTLPKKEEAIEKGPISISVK